MKKRYVRAKELAIFLGIGKSTVWYWAKESKLIRDTCCHQNLPIPDNLFPLPQQISAKTTVWDLIEIENWHNKKRH